MVGPVEVGTDDYQIFPAVQALQKLQQVLFFPETGVPSAVNAETHEAIRFQQFQAGKDGRNAGLAAGGQ